MKKILYIICGSVLLLWQCNSPTSNNSTTTSDESASEVVEEKIVFDESQGVQSTDRNFYFLFDGSGSMAKDCAGEIKMKGAKKAIEQFLQKVPDNVNLGLLIFGTSANNGITEVVPLGPSNREKFLEAIYAVEAIGKTPLSAATKTGINRLVDQYKKQLGYGEYRLIIVTDGMANDPALFENTLHESLRYPFIAIYGIGLCMDEAHALKKLSYKYTDANDYDELGKALEETIAELPNFDPTEFDGE